MQRIVDLKHLLEVLRVFQPEACEYIESLGSDFLISKCNCNDVDSLFTWSEQPQGHEYWSRLNHDLNLMCENDELPVLKKDPVHKKMKHLMRMARKRFERNGHIIDRFEVYERSLYSNIWSPGCKRDNCTRRIFISTEKKSVMDDLLIIYRSDGILRDRCRGYR